MIIELLAIDVRLEKAMITIPLDNRRILSIFVLAAVLDPGESLTNRP